MQPQTSSQALSAAQQYQSGMQSPLQELQGAESQLGTSAAQQQVSGLRSAINNTTNLLNNVAPGVMGRTGQSLETSAQANREIQNEQAPISATLGKQQQDYQSANADYANLEAKAESLANANESAQQNQLGYLMNVYSALYGQEQGAAQAAAQQSQFGQSLAEQAREANLAASSASSGAAAPSLNSLLGGSGSSIDPQLQKAANDVLSVLKNNNVGQLRNYYTAISKSAGYGNPYDKQKLQLLQQYAQGTPYANLVNKVLKLGTF